MTLLERCVGRPASELAEFPPEQLLDLQMQARNAMARAKAIADLIDRALGLRYSRAAAVHRVAAGKDAGRVSFNDGVVRVSVELPKRIGWDQAALGRIVDRIRKAGEDPSEFVEVTYRVSEAKYSAWPASMRALFDPARTLRTGKPSFRLAPAGDES